MELPSALLGPSLKKKIYPPPAPPPKKCSLYFSKWDFLALILKNFKERKPRKKFLIFLEMELFSSNIKKFQETETLKKLLIFWEMEPFSPPRENFLYFRKEKQKKAFLKSKLFLHFRTLNPRKNSLYIRKWNFLIF